MRIFNRALLTLLSFTCGYYASFSQTVEKKIMSNICEYGVLQNDYLLLKKQFKGFSVIVDPRTGSRVINYPAHVNDKTKEAFNKYSMEEQIKILNSDSLSAFPIGDTLIIVDNLKFFNDGMTFIKGSHYFRISRAAEGNKSANTTMVLYAAGIRGNSLILSFAFKKRDYLLNFYFGLKEGTINLVKTSRVDRTPTFE